MILFLDTSTEPITSRHMETAEELIRILAEKNAGSCSFITNLPIHPLSIAAELVRRFTTETLFFSTFSLPTDPLLKELRELHELGFIKTINAILPNTHQRTADIIVRAKTIDLCRFTGGECKILKNHSKVATIEGEKPLAILSSSNPAFHMAIENYTILYGSEAVSAIKHYFRSKCYD